MFARTLIYKEYLILISLHDSLFYSLTFQIHIHIHIFISEVTCYFCNFCYRLTILLPLKFFFTFLPLKFFFTFLPFYPFTFKLRPDVAPTAWRRNLFCVPTLPSLHRHAFSSPSYRILILLASLFHLTFLLLFPLPCGGLLKKSPCVRQQFKM